VKASTALDESLPIPKFGSGSPRPRGRGLPDASRRASDRGPRGRNRPRPTLELRRGAEVLPPSPTGGGAGGGVASGPFLVSRTGDAGSTGSPAEAPKKGPTEATEGRRPIETAGRWPWKTDSAKECVTTHLPNGPAPKMDGAQPLAEAGPARRTGARAPEGEPRRRVRRSRGSLSARGGGAASAADLGGSSKHPSETLGV
jgi:hypothetical protein